MNVVTSDWESACDLELERAPYEGQLYGVLGAPFFLFQHGPDGVRQISTLLKDLPFETKLVHTGIQEVTGLLMAIAPKGAMSLGCPTPSLQILAIK